MAMNKLLIMWLLLALVACQQDSDPNTPVSETQSSETKSSETQNSETKSSDNFQWVAERFADIRIIRYQIPDFDRLSLKQKKLVYYLSQAGMAGRDIFWDQNYRHNLSIRHALEAIITAYQGDKSSANWQALMLYARQVFFASGVHHHYSGDKFEPQFSQDYFESLLHSVGFKLDALALRAIFDKDFDAKKISLDPNGDLVLDSAVNFYAADVTDAEVEAFYADKSNANKNNTDTARPVLHGLNSTLVRNADGALVEQVWYLDGLYGAAIKHIVQWLQKAVSVAENPAQAHALNLLIDYYRTGDLQTWDEYNIAWLNATAGDVDYIHSFIEVYQDPKGTKGSFESIVQIKDFAASQRMQVVANNAQWFEDNSPTDVAHKKAQVVGVSYNVVSVVSETGDASPASPVGVNLPNSDWIRAEHGSKSVSLGNIVNAYNQARNPSVLQEFVYDQSVIERNKAHRQLSSKMHTALHEVIGHASGKLVAGVATPKQTLKNYSSALEEARADLVALYFIMDKKLVEMGLIASLEVAKASYDSYILNGLMLQLRRIKAGDNIEQAHMRNRQMVANWVLEQGLPDKVIEPLIRDGKTYFKINDYQKLRDLFGQLLNEVQRIKSQGDYTAGRNLIENYGVKVNQDLHQEVLARVAKLNIAPYSGFINPVLQPVNNDQGEISDIVVTYPDDFITQMLDYGQRYATLR